MRITTLIFLLQLATIIGLTALAIGQSDEPSETQVGIVKQESETVARPSSTSSASIIKKFEDWVGLTDSRLEDLAAMAERLQAEIAKMKTLHTEATVAGSKSNLSFDAQPPAAAAPVPAASAAPVPASAASAAPETPAVVKAEIDASESFDSVAGDDLGDTVPLPVLNGSTPDWVKKGLVLGDEHSFAISSTLLPDLDQCREDLKSRMMSDVQVYLDKHVLEFTSSYKIPELTQEYVEKNWVKKGQEFDNIQDRPSGTYHQLWIGLHISSEQLTKIRAWEKQSVREQRTKKAGVLGGVGIFAISILSGAVGLLARREKAKLRG